MMNSYIHTGRRQSKSILGFCCAAALITLIILLLTCFAAVTFATADKKLQSAEKNADYCSKYYAAETTATEILCDFMQRDGSISSKNGRSQYDAAQGSIEVTSIDGNVFFTVPVNKKQGLHVDVQVTENGAAINKWNIEE